LARNRGVEPPRTCRILDQTASTVSFYECLFQANSSAVGLAVCFGKVELFKKMELSICKVRYILKET
jgi:hypothetical protein